jgi:hypothetical protein
MAGDAIKIPLTQGKTALVDAQDGPRASSFRWYAWKSRASRVWYARRTVYRESGKPTYQFLHQLILPGEARIDHIDRNGLNNRRSNLRPCSRGQNRANSVKNRNCRSRFKGVTWHIRDQVWHAQIVINKTRHHLGSWRSERQAAQAYDRAAKVAFKSFARTNFI